MNIDPINQVALHAEAQLQAELGGLHNHSIGSFYPWAVVGRGQEGAWEVHNLQCSTVVYYKGKVWQGACAEALAVAEMAKHGLYWMDGYEEQAAPPSLYEQALLERLQKEESKVLRDFRAKVIAAGANQRPYAGRPSSYPARAQEAALNLGEAEWAAARARGEH